MNQLETDGLTVLGDMDLMCFGDLGDVPACAVAPNAMVSRQENLEFDYFVLHRGVCLVGEISGLSNESDLRRKYRTFCQNVRLLASADRMHRFDPFQIPREARHLFREVRSVQAFFIAAQLERFDVDLGPIAGVSVLYHSDWQTLASYATAFRRYAQGPFFRLVGVNDVWDAERDLRFEAQGHNLLRLPSRFVAGGLEVRADVFTMVTSPADLLEVAEVFRRELMPIVAVDTRNRYQRPLDFAKLAKMRELIIREDFMFPNSILVALDSACRYDQQDGRLYVPMIYGAVSVIDGQHRLYAYAMREVPDEIRRNARILVTALKFDTEVAEELLRSSARAFVEINRTQKRISSNHIDEIAYPVLGEDYPRALAAQVILRANQRPRGSLSGLFRSSQTTAGVYHAATVIAHLAGSLNLGTIASLISADGTDKALRRQGYESLFGTKVEQLAQAPELIERAAGCLQRYFDIVARVFASDWPRRGEANDSSLGYTKVFAAFVRLLSEFIREGLDWCRVELELTRIRCNILAARGVDPDRTPLVLDRTDPTVPDDQPSVTDTFKYLSANRSAPTTISEIQQPR